CWLDHEKTLPKQCPATIELIFYFSVKFYPTRSAPVGGRIHQISVRSGKSNAIWSTACCPALRNTMALLASYLVQGER
uniref:UBC core domain-containing protein n=1 Tax=Macrostomum lignano TaxID=282301 RepID=A0A1I8GBT5_9PLAT